jgi:hypothetical protein
MRYNTGDRLIDLAPADCGRRCAMVLRACMAALLATLGGAGALGQTIQLPSVHTFSVETTVIVPDSGRSRAASDKRAAVGANRFGGVPFQRAAGVERQAVGAAVVAKIHDPEEADRATLDGAKTLRAKATSATTPTRVDLTLRANDPGLKSLAEIKRERVRQAAELARETLALVEKARDAQAEGRSSAAALYYRTASRQATGALKQQIDAQLRRLKSESAPANDSKQSAR